MHKLAWPPHARFPSTVKRQADQKFKVILGYTGSSKPALATRDLVSKTKENKAKQPKAPLNVFM